MFPSIDQTKLRSLFNVLVKSGLFVFFLNLAASFKFWPVFLLLLFLIFIYASEMAKAKRIQGQKDELGCPHPSCKISFWLIPIFALIALYFSANIFFVPAWFFLAFAAFIFLLREIIITLNLYNLASLLHTSLFLFLFSSFFLADLPNVTSLAKTAVAIVSFFALSSFVFKEAIIFSFFSFCRSENNSSAVFNFDSSICRSFSETNQVRLISALLGFVTIQVSFILAFSPLGIINSAVFATLTAFFLKEGVISHFRGELNFSFILRQLTFFVVLAIIIFAATKWSL